MKKNIPDIILILVLITGLSLLLYPTVSDWWNSFHSSRAIVDYTNIVAQIDNTRYDQIWEDVKEYNAGLVNRPYRWTFTEKEKAEYNAQLAVSDSGIMGYVEIPAIDCSLPVYHGTGENVLAAAVGHMEGSSLPAGGANTHCVLSGHRGLPSAKLFTDLDRLVLGDTFTLNVLDKSLTYEIDQILTVLPEEMDALEIIDGKDLCTLVTCTPYGINSHRLLVRGHRIEVQQAEPVGISGDAVQIAPAVVAPVIALPLILISLVFFLAAAARKGDYYE